MSYAAYLAKVKYFAMVKKGGVSDRRPGKAPATVWLLELYPRDSI